jgi:hypothetical protein
VAAGVACAAAAVESVAAGTGAGGGASSAARAGVASAIVSAPHSTANLKNLSESIVMTTSVGDALARLSIQTTLAVEAFRNARSLVKCV